MTTISQQIENAIDDNDHTLATIIAASAMGGELGNAYAVILREIDSAHELNGYITQDHLELRDAIQKQVFEILKARGLM